MANNFSALKDCLAGTFDLRSTEQRAERGDVLYSMCAWNAASLAGDKAAQAKLNEAAQGLSNACVQLLDSALEQPEQALMLSNAARIDGLARAVDEAVRAGRAEEAAATAAALQNALHKQVRRFGLTTRLQ